ncbi:MAG TPA: nuclear transport factor 2 family protein [Sphingomicrobium sp.]
MLSLLLAALTAAPVTVPPQPQLTEQIAKADAELFDLFFVRPCDEPAFRALLADDVEFYHDKDGFNVHSADEFMKDYRQNCSSRADPTNWRSRRELVRSSLQVDPIPGYGAMEAGDHLFYERHGVDGTEKLAGRARFAMVWVLGADGKWRLSRVLSFGHAAADAPR